MSSNPSEALAGSGIGRNGVFGDHAHRLERRRRVRTAVHWPMTLFRADSREAIAATTVNLSSDGFYCSLSARFAPGERVLVLLHVPSYDPTGRESTYTLKCKAEVVRIEPRDGTCGVACRIEDYSLARAGAEQAPLADA